MKDISDQIENEDQLDEARKQGEEKEDDQRKEPDVKPEDNALESSENFEGKTQNLEAAGKDKCHGIFLVVTNYGYM